jgi:hypothetical protein
VTFVVKIAGKPRASPGLRAAALSVRYRRRTIAGGRKLARRASLEIVALDFHAADASI